MTTTVTGTTLCQYIKLEYVTAKKIALIERALLPAIRKVDLQLCVHNKYAYVTICFDYIVTCCFIFANQIEFVNNIHGHNMWNILFSIKCYMWD